MKIDRTAINLSKAIIKVVACLWVQRPDLIADIGINAIDDLFEKFCNDFIIADSVKNKLRKLQ